MQARLSIVFACLSVVIDVVAAQIESVTWEGSGCPPNSIGLAVSDDRHIATAIFDSFSAEIGTSAIGEAAAECSVEVTLSGIGEGFQAVWDNVTWRGYTGIGQGASVDIGSGASWEGQSGNDFHENWLWNAEAGPESIDHVLSLGGAMPNDRYGSQCSPQGGQVTLTFSLAVSLDGDGGDMDGLSQIDSLDFWVGLKEC